MHAEGIRFLVEVEEMVFVLYYTPGHAKLKEKVEMSLLNQSEIVELEFSDSIRFNLLEHQLLIGLILALFVAAARPTLAFALLSLPVVGEGFPSILSLFHRINWVLRLPDWLILDFFVG